ncbi:hypothetical protein HDV62DRAFT_382076 [Trichoderma sp. SZMC 28011]
MDLLSCLPLFLLIGVPATRFHHMQFDPHPSPFKCLLSCLSLHTPTKRASGFPFAHQSNRPQLLRSPQVFGIGKGGGLYGGIRINTRREGEMKIS